MPSRLHPGKFYALPQAPQQFKQLIMVAGFDRYFQIAPCFRDEDARADRSPGEFYQLDVEMSFVTQEDVFAAIEPVLRGVFEEFGDGKPVTPKFPLIPYADAMRKYGTDKPDLRNPIEMQDVTEHFRGSGFKVFASMLEQAGDRGAGDPGAGRRQPRVLRPHERLGAGRGRAGAGLHLLASTGGGKALVAPRDRSPRILGRPKRTRGRSCATTASALGPGRATRCSSSPASRRSSCKFAGPARTKIGDELGLIDKDRFEFCWIVDFPMYEWNEEEKKIDFSHNPFSMPNMAAGRVPRARPERQARRSSASRRSSTTSSATASSCRRARSATTGPTS